MARRSGGGGMRSRPAPRPIAKSATSSMQRPAAQPASMTPISKPKSTTSPSAPAAAAPIASSGGAPSISGGGLLSTLASGMAFGTGSSIAHRAIDSVMGSSKSDDRPVQNESPSSFTEDSFAKSSNGNDQCRLDMKALRDCMASNEDNVSYCKYYFDALRQCQERSQLSFQDD